MARVQYSAAARGPRKTAEIPDELATWYVDDWISDDEEPRSLGKVFLDEQQRLEDLCTQRQLLSRKRFVSARAEYARQVEAAGGIAPVFPRVGQPRRRNPNTRKAQQ